MRTWFTFQDCWMRANCSLTYSLTTMSKFHLFLLQNAAGNLDLNNSRTMSRLTQKLCDLFFRWRAKNGNIVPKTSSRCRALMISSRDASTSRSSLKSTRRFQINTKLQCSTTIAMWSLESAKLFPSWPKYGFKTCSKSTKWPLKAWVSMRLSQVLSKAVLLAREHGSNILSELSRGQQKIEKSLIFIFSA